MTGIPKPESEFRFSTKNVFTVFRFFFRGKFSEFRNRKRNSEFRPSQESESKIQIPNQAKRGNSVPRCRFPISTTYGHLGEHNSIICPLLVFLDQQDARHAWEHTEHDIAETNTSRSCHSRWWPQQPWSPSTPKTLQTLLLTSMHPSVVVGAATLRAPQPFGIPKAW